MFSNYTSSVLSTSTTTFNTWTHVAVSWRSSGTQISFYINGVAAGPSSPTFAMSADNASHSVLIGKSGVGNFLNGSITDLRVWYCTRSAIKIQTNMLQNIGGYTPGLTCLYRVNETTGATINDSSPNALYGTINNATKRPRPTILPSTNGSLCFCGPSNATYNQYVTPVNYLTGFLRSYPNTFTIEMWAKPLTSITIVPESITDKGA